MQLLYYCESQFICGFTDISTYVIYLGLIYFLVISKNVASHFAGIFIALNIFAFKILSYDKLGRLVYPVDILFEKNVQLKKITKNHCTIQ